MNRGITCIIILLMSLSICFAEPDPQKLMQIPTTSWHGLTGLYVIPTARMIGRNNLAVGFNESKHTEFVKGEKFNDRQIRGVITYGVTEWAEVYVSHFNNMYMIPPDREPSLHNQSFNTFGLKFLLMKEDPNYWFPAVAIGIRDIGNTTNDVQSLKDVNNGTKVFLLASKQLLKNKDICRFLDFHLGLTWDEKTMAGLAGFELTLAPNVSLIAEGIWDSPYLNFREYGSDNVQGRFLFNTGLRIYPELIPGLALDLGFIGDSEFEFSFGPSYVVNF